MSKAKMGRPRLPEGAKGRVYTFFAPKDLSDNLEDVLEHTGGTISDFLRDAVSEAVKRDLEKIKLRMLTGPNSALTAYLESV